VQGPAWWGNQAARNTALYLSYTGYGIGTDGEAADTVWPCLRCWTTVSPLLRARCQLGPDRGHASVSKANFLLFDN
jgi:hypothetical protein